MNPFFLLAGYLSRKLAAANALIQVDTTAGVGIPSKTLDLGVVCASCFHLGIQSPWTQDTSTKQKLFLKSWSSLVLRMLQKRNWTLCPKCSAELLD